MRHLEDLQMTCFCLQNSWFRSYVELDRLQLPRNRSVRYEALSFERRNEHILIEFFIGPEDSGCVIPRGSHKLVMTRNSPPFKFISFGAES